MNEQPTETLDAMRERCGIKTQIFTDAEDVARLFGIHNLDAAVDKLRKTRIKQEGVVGVEVMTTGNPLVAGLLQIVACFKKSEINGFTLYMIKGRDPNEVLAYRIRLRREIEGIVNTTKAVAV